MGLSVLFDVLKDLFWFWFTEHKTNINTLYRMSYRMSKSRGTNCVVIGCRKRTKNKECDGETVVRSESEGSEDEESTIKRMFPRTFHR